MESPEFFHQGVCLKRDDAISMIIIWITDMHSFNRTEVLPQSS